MEKLVSIVLPVYNGEKYIAKSIESVLAQTYSNIELIIVNDCSTDSTLEIINHYKANDSRIKIVNNIKNQRLPKSLNIGFSEASGEYFSWTSDDNMYKENAIEKMVSCLETNNADFVNANYSNIDENDNIIKSVYTLADINKLMFGNNIGACFLYTKSIAKKVGEYDANLFLAEDYDYWIRIGRHGKMCHIDDDLYLYRWHEQSLTQTKCKQVCLQSVKTIEKHFLYFSSLLNKKEKFSFYDFILWWLRDFPVLWKEEYCMLVKCDPRYLRYLKINKIKNLIKKSRFFILLYKIKRRIISGNE